MHKLKAIALILALLGLVCLATAHGRYACETTVFLNGKCSNTTYISKNWTESKKNRSSENTQAVATLCWTGCCSPHFFSFYVENKTDSYTV